MRVFVCIAAGRWYRVVIGRDVGGIQGENGPKWGLKMVQGRRGDIGRCTLEI